MNRFIALCFVVGLTGLSAEAEVRASRSGSSAVHPLGMAPSPSLSVQPADRAQPRLEKLTTNSEKSPVLVSSRSGGSSLVHPIQAKR